MAKAKAKRTVRTREEIEKSFDDRVKKADKAIENEMKSHKEKRENLMKRKSEIKKKKSEWMKKKSPKAMSKPDLIKKLSGKLSKKQIIALLEK